MRLALAIALAFAPSCVSTQQHNKSNALEYLYPTGAPTEAPRDVSLTLPVRVGVAFAPSAPSEGRTRVDLFALDQTESDASSDPFTPDQKTRLLERMAASFRGREGIAAVEVLSPSHLNPAGGFAELDRLKQAYGLDLIALVSYDQFQFSESGTSSWTYWTVVGAYVVEGEENETRTLMDAVVYDIPSRTMLFTASGQSAVRESSTPLDAERALRETSAKGFEQAADDLVLNLEPALAKFQEASAKGTVRGPGTAPIAVLDSAGQPVQGGAGAAGPLEALLVGAALAATLAGRRRA